MSSPRTCQRNRFVLRSVRKSTYVLKLQGFMASALRGEFKMEDNDLFGIMWLYIFFNNFLAKTLILLNEHL